MRMRGIFAVILSLALVIAGGQAYGIRAYAGSVQARAAYSEAGDPFAQGSSDRIKLKKVKASAGVNTMTLKFKRAVTKKEIQDINAYYGLTGKETATRGEACYIIDETEGTLGPVSVTVSRGSKKAAAQARTVTDADGDSYSFVLQSGHKYRLVDYAYFVGGKPTYTQSAASWTKNTSFKVK